MTGTRWDNWIGSRDVSDAVEGCEGCIEPDIYFIDGHWYAVDDMMPLSDKETLLEYFRAIGFAETDNKLATRGSLSPPPQLAGYEIDYDESD